MWETDFLVRPPEEEMPFGIVSLVLAGRQKLKVRASNPSSRVRKFCGETKKVRRL